MNKRVKLIVLVISTGIITGCMKDGGNEKEISQLMNNISKLDKELKSKESVLELKEKELEKLEEEINSKDERILELEESLIREVEDKDVIEIEGKEAYILADVTYYRDLNYDSKKENINVKFTCDNIENYAPYSYEITIKSNGKTHKYIKEASFVYDLKLNFVELNEKNYFYVNDEGPSDDPHSIFYELSEDGIDEVLVVDGDIVYMDINDGLIYTSFNYSTDKNKVVLSYYDIEEGLKYPEKSEVIGKYLQFDRSLILYESDKTTEGYRSSQFYTDGWELIEIDDLKGMIDERGEEFGIVDISEINEKLKILEVNYNPHDFHEDIVRNLPIKVETEDGLQGWLLWLNGGD